MIPASIEEFGTVLILDTEYVAELGEPYDPVALGVQVYGADEVRVYRRDEVLQWRKLPFPIDADTLIVCYNAAAESGFLHVLDLGMPVWWLDLMAESRVLRNVCLPKRSLDKFVPRHPEIPSPNREMSLLKTAEWLGVEGGDGDVKAVGRDLVLSRKWASGDETVWQQIVDYCASDVRLTTRLFAKMEPHFALQAALIRGSYVAEQGRMSQRVIPVDVETFRRLQREYGRILRQYRVDMDPMGVRLTAKGRVRQTWLAGKLKQLGAEAFHRQTAKGQWSTKLTALQETADRYEDRELQQVAEWVEMLHTFPEGKDGALRISPMGRDGRVRYHQFPFDTHTGRSLGSGKEALMQLPKWMRGLITPQPGEVLIAADYSAEEIAVAAGLSGDVQLRAAYEAGDPYVALGEMAGMIQPGMEPGQVLQARKICKSLALGRQYGMGFRAFRKKSGASYSQAARVWQFFERTFTKFADWQQRSVAQARRRGWITTRYGWKAQVVTQTRETTLFNWPVQAGAGDVLRLAVILAAQEGLEILTTCHDSLLVSVPENQAEGRCAALVGVMQDAAKIAVGVPIRVDVQVLHAGERLLTAETRPMWEYVMGLLGEGERGKFQGQQY